MIVYVAELKPVLLASGAEQTLRYCSHPSASRTDGVDWLPMLATPLRRSTQLFDGEFKDQPIDYGALEVAFSKGHSGAPLTSYGWDGRSVKIWRGTAGQTTAQMTLVFGGTAESVSGNRRRYTVKLRGPNLDKPLLGSTYLGTGGAEGPAELRGTLKPMLVGTAMNIAPVYVNRALGIFQYHAYPQVQGSGALPRTVTAVYDSGSQLGTSIGDFADYAALAAANVPAGRFATCNALGMGRHGGDITGVLTIDAGGSMPGGLPGDILVYFLNSIGGLDPATQYVADDLTWLTTQLNHPHDWYITEQMTVEEACRELMLSMGGYIWYTDDGRFTVGLVRRGAAASLTLDRQNIRDATFLSTSSPVYTRRQGYNRAWRRHSYSEVRTPAEIKPRGVWSAAPNPVYQYYDMVEYGDSSYIYVYPTAGDNTTPGTNTAVWQFFQKTGAVVFEGASAPPNPVNGMLWRNSTTGLLSWYFGGTWTGLADITAQHTAAAIAGQGPGATAPAAEVLNYREAGGVLMIDSPGGGQWSVDSPITGAIKIKLPQLWSNSMLRFAVDVYDYAAGAMQTYIVSGYNYTGSGSGGHWFNVSAAYIGPENRSKPVSFGSDADGAVIWIGGAVTEWQYPKVVVRNVQVGFNNATPAKWLNGWFVGIDSGPFGNLGGQNAIFPVIAKPRPGDSVFGESVFEVPGGAVATLPAFKTEQGTAAAIAGQGPGATAPSTDVMNYRQQGEVMVVDSPAGASIRADNVNVGFLIVRLPLAIAGKFGMLKFTVDAFDYGGNNQERSGTWEISGYWNGQTPSWSAVTAKYTGRRVWAGAVYFGIDAGGPVVVFGTSNRAWSYMHARVRDFQVTYTDASIDAWRTGWAMGIQSGGIANTQYTVSNPAPGDAVFGENVLEDGAGTVGTLPAFKTIQGISAGFSGQGALAVLNAIADGYLTGPLATRLAPHPLNNLFLSGSTIAYEAGQGLETLKPYEIGSNVTENRVAASIAGQGVFATRGYANWSEVLSGSRPLALRDSQFFPSGYMYASGVYNDLGNKNLNEYYPEDMLSNRTENRVAASIAGQGPGATASALRVLNDVEQGGVTYVSMPGGGSYGGAADSTGRIRIRLPKQATYTMVRFYVDVYDYNFLTSVTYVVAGYVYNGAGEQAWHNVSAQLIGPESKSVPVRFGYNGGWPMITIGNDNTGWYYPQITVRDVTVGYSGQEASSWREGWVVTIATSDMSVTAQTITRPRAGDAVFGEGVLEGAAGAVATLGNFKTSQGTAAAIAGQTAWATYAASVNRISRLNDVGRVLDPTIYNTQALLGPSSTTNLAPAYTVGASNVTVSLPAHSRKVAGPSGPITLSYGAASGTVGFSTYWVAYIDDPDLTGFSSPTVSFSGDPDVLLYPGRYFIASGISPDSAGTGGGTGTGGDGGPRFDNCVAEYSWVEVENPLSRECVTVMGRHWVRARDVVPMDRVRVLVDGADLTDWRTVRSNFVIEAQGVRLTTESGWVLDLSETTPVTQRDGTTILAMSMAGHEVAVDNHGVVEWEQCRVEFIGTIDVAHLSCSNGTYLAGNEPGQGLFTHNMEYKP